MRKLTVKETYKAISEGKKLTRSDWGDHEYIHLVDDEIVDETGDLADLFFSLPYYLYQEDEWHSDDTKHETFFVNLVPALLDGKKIQRKNWKACIYFNSDSELVYGKNSKDYEDQLYYFTADDFKGPDWYVCGDLKEQEVLMSFNDAINAVRDGKKIRRKGWPSGRDTVDNYNITITDITTNDWMVVEE